MDMRKGQKEERRRISVEDVARANHDSVGRYKLFAHSFTGSDTSSIYNYGKTKILDKIRDSPAVRVEIDKFYIESQCPEVIGNSSIKLLNCCFLIKDKFH